jgi:hypothetical protein
MHIWKSSQRHELRKCQRRVKVRVYVCMLICVHTDIHHTLSLFLSRTYSFVVVRAGEDTSISIPGGISGPMAPHNAAQGVYEDEESEHW